MSQHYPSWRNRGVCYAPLAAASTAAAPYLAPISLGMSILGGINQSDAQLAQGQAAYQTALNRAMMAKAEGDEEDQNAGQAEAGSQRTAILAQRKGSLAASRLRAVMGASGAGVDENLLASVQGEGDYNRDVALYQGADKARVMRNQAAMTRYSGQAGLQQGQYADQEANQAADATMVGTIGKGVLSFADKYGGGTPTGDSYKVASPTDTMTAYNNMPASFRIPGFDNLS